MRCDCCDRELSDSEATAKYVETDGSKPHRYVGMCGKCRREAFDGTNIRYVIRRDLSTTSGNEPELADPWDLGEADEDL